MTDFLTRLRAYTQTSEFAGLCGAAVGAALYLYFWFVWRIDLGTGQTF
jgi:hypothetical protein